MQSMELQMFGAKILAALLFISLLQASVATTASTASHNQSTTAVSSNVSTTAASHNHSTTAVSSNASATAASPNHSTTAVSPNVGTTAASRNYSTTAAPANHSTKPPSPRSKRLSRRTMKKRFGNFTPEFNWEQQQYLKAHNDLRRQMGIPPLQWDPGLAVYAHSWALQRREDCKYRNHSRGHNGENSFWMQYKDFTPTEVVQNWFSEQKFFDHKRNVCKCKIENDDCECGHYLNVIWKTTKKMGCSGYVYCTDQQGLLVFCSYFPPGNYRGVNPMDPGNA